MENDFEQMLLSINLERKRFLIIAILMISSSVLFSAGDLNLIIQFISLGLPAITFLLISGIVQSPIVFVLYSVVVCWYILITFFYNSVFFKLLALFFCFWLFIFLEEFHEFYHLKYKTLREVIQCFTIISLILGVLISSIVCYIVIIGIRLIPDIDNAGYLGIIYRPSMPFGFVHSKLSVEPGTGGIIVRVCSNSPADRIGLRSGDIIVALNDQRFDSSENAYFCKQIMQYNADTEVKLTIIRSNGKIEKIDLNVKLDFWPEKIKQGMLLRLLSNYIKSLSFMPIIFSLSVVSLGLSIAVLTIQRNWKIILSVSLNIGIFGTWIFLRLNLL